MLEENEEITVKDIQDTEAELGIDIDECDYYCYGVTHRW